MATHNATETVAATKTNNAKGREGFTVTLQTEWFQRNKGRMITARLMDGTRLSGLLAGWDTYTVAIRVAGREEAVLLSKHGVALFMRREGEDKEKAV